MFSSKTPRILLSLLLLLGAFASTLVLPSVQADTSGSATLSPAVISKIDAFVVKVQSLRPKYNSDADWNTFLDKLGSKVDALKPKYTGNALILAVLDRLSVGVMGLRAQKDVASNIGSSVPAATTISTTGNQSLGSPLDSSPLKNTNVILKFIDGSNNSDSENAAIAASNNLPSNRVVTGPATLNVFVWNTFRFSMDYGESRSFQFTTGPRGEYYDFDMGMTTFVGADTWRFLNISTMPNDFRYDNYDAKNGCAAMSSPVHAQVVDMNDYSRFMVCRLRPNTTYYLNVRNERIDLNNRNGNQRGIDMCNTPDGNGNMMRDCGFVFRAAATPEQYLGASVKIPTSPDPTISALKIPQEYAK